LQREPGTVVWKLPSFYEGVTFAYCLLAQTPAPLFRNGGTDES
jgi:hypothetical protein